MKMDLRFYFQIFIALIKALSWLFLQFLGNSVLKSLHSTLIYTHTHNSPAKSREKYDEV